jgi:hypothetical protein
MIDGSMAAASVRDDPRCFVAGCSAMCSCLDEVQKMCFVSQDGQKARWRCAF